MAEVLGVDISWLGVLIAGIALFALGALWYVPLLGKVYRRELGVAESADGAPALPDGATFGKALLGQLIAGLIMATVLAWLIGNSSAGRGAIVGLAAGVLLGAALLQLYQFEGRSIRHLLINVGYLLVGATVAGSILGAFQAP